MSARTWPVLLLALVATGCGRACKNDHPFVPYTIGDGGASVSPSSELVDDEPDDASTGAPRLLAVDAPRDASAWELEGLALRAPPDRVFVSAIVRDFDGDGARDAAAIVRGTLDPALVELVTYRGSVTGLAAPSVVGAAPPTPGLSACTPRARLALLGRSTLWAELGAECEPPATGKRRLLALRPGATHRVLYGATVVDPPRAPRVSVDADARDADGDGNEDLELRVTVGAAPGPFATDPALSATLAFVDRPAGLARVSDEPERSLLAAARSVTKLAARAKDAPLALATARQLREVYRALCPEGGAARLGETGGAVSVRCGRSAALELASVAEVRAHLARGDALRAFSTAARAQRAPAAETAARTKELAAMLQKAAERVEPSVRTVDLAVPARSTTSPEWGALAFESSGALLVRGDARVSRVQPTTGVVEDSEIPPWALKVTAASGDPRWLEAYYGCAGGPIHGTLLASSSGDMKDVLLPVATPLGARCAGAKGTIAESVPVRWGPEGLVAVVSGELVSIATDGATSVELTRLPVASSPAGSPAAPTGSLLAQPLGDQVLVVGGDRPRLWSMAPGPALSSCTVRSDGSAIACVRGGRVLLASAPAAP